MPMAGFLLESAGCAAMFTASLPSELIIRLPARHTGSRCHQSREKNSNDGQYDLIAVLEKLTIRKLTNL